MECRTGKKVYLTKGEAERALVWIKVLRNSPRRKEKRAHNCNHCKKWHLTSSESTKDRRVSKTEYELGMTRTQKRKAMRRRAKERKGNNEH